MEKRIYYNTFLQKEVEEIVATLDDFEIGDIVIGAKGIVPQYLQNDDMVVINKGTKNLVLSNRRYPNEKFYISPREVKKCIQ